MKRNESKSGGNVLDNIKKLEQQREERRAKLQGMKDAKVERQARNEAAGRMVDCDFDDMVREQRANIDRAINHVQANTMKICICVRKRPLFGKEVEQGEIDSVSCSNPKIYVHEPKIKVDGITKYIQNHEFTFDNTYGNQETSKHVYDFQVNPLISTLYQKGVVTMFAYGQTGSGKTFTITDITNNAIKALFAQASQEHSFTMSFFEIYGGKVSDLLNGKKKLAIQEDANNRIQVTGLVERDASSEQEMQEIIAFGHAERTTHQTAANDTSSRSHAIAQILVRDGSGKRVGKLLIVDLAGSERAQDTQSNNRQRRMEGAEINKSLLALKECIRALDNNNSHVPFRASKLTMVLRDSFLNQANQSSKIVMIACINPGSSSADHTINTLRYAQRLKDEKSTEQNYANKQQLGALPYVQDVHEQTTKPTGHNFLKPAAAQIPQEQLLREPKSEGQGVRAVSNPPPQKSPAIVPQRMNQQIGAKQAYGQDQDTSLPPINARQQAQVGQDESPVQLQNNNQPSKMKPPVSSNQRGPTSKAPNNDPLQRVNQQVVQKQQEERKRAQWGQQANPTNERNSGSQQRQGVFQPRANPNQNQQQRGGNSQIQIMQSPEQKKLKMNDLKQTLTGGGAQMMAGQDNNNLLTFHEKVDNIMDEQDELRNIHLEYLKEAAQLLTQEGELISNLQGIGGEECDIDVYVEKMESIVQRNLDIYTDMRNHLGRFKKLLKEEEDAHKNVRSTFYY